MPLVNLTGHQGTPQMPYTRKDFYPLGMGEQGNASNEITEGIKEESEILEPTVRERLDVILPLGNGDDDELEQRMRYAH